MNGLEDTTAVVGCVAAIVSAYQDGTELLHDIEQRRRESTSRQSPHVDERASQDFELSIARGQEVIKNQYERDFKRLGSAFATGDQLARDSLKEIVVCMQRDVITPLKIAWHNHTPIDYFTLQDISDESQDRAIMVLMQLHQRLLVAAPIDMISGAGLRNARAGKPQGFVDADGNRQQARRSSTELYRYGNHVEISGGSNIEKKSRFMLGRKKKPNDDNDRYTPSPRQSPSLRIPPTSPPTSPHQEQKYDRYYDTRRGEHFYSTDAPDTHREPSEPSSGGDPDRTTYSQGHLQPQPARELPIRHSVVSSVSSFGSSEHEHPEYNPWATGGPGTISPLSSIASEIAAGNPYSNPLVPDPLETRRNPESLHSRATSASATLNVQSEDASYDGSYEKINKPWLTETESVYSVASSNQPSYYGSASPSDFTRQKNIMASQTPPPHELWGREEKQKPLPDPRARSEDQLEPQYQQPAAQHPALRTASSSPYPPHHRNHHFTQGPISPPLSPEEYHGPPPTSPPDRPIPKPAPRIPERAANRPSPGNTPPKSGTPSNDAPCPVPPAVSSMPTMAVPPINAGVRNPHGPISPMTPMSPRFVPESLGPAPDKSATQEAPPTALLASDLMFTTISTAPVPKPKPKPKRRESTRTTASIRSASTTASTATKGPLAPGAPPPTPIRTIPAATKAAPGNVRALLPNEANKYAGFCKCAWRAQIGDQKKTWEERNRPGGMYGKTTVSYLRCQKCQFEGGCKLNAAGKAEKAAKNMAPPTDAKIYGADGVLYKWPFLFKSHISQSRHGLQPIDAEYGCLFCTAEGKGTPVFSGVENLLGHLRLHRGPGRQPGKEVQFVLCAIVGREPNDDEEWEIVLPENERYNPAELESPRLVLEMDSFMPAVEIGGREGLRR